MKRNHWLLIGLVAVLLVTAGSAFIIKRQAGEHRSSHERGISIQGQPVIELARALDIAGKHVHGEVVKVELERDDDRFTYEIKVLADNGRVREIKLDAQTGSLIEIEDD